MFSVFLAAARPILDGVFSIATVSYNMLSLVELLIIAPCVVCCWMKEDRKVIHSRDVALRYSVLVNINWPNLSSWRRFIHRSRRLRSGTCCPMPLLHSAAAADASDHLAGATATQHANHSFHICSHTST